MFNIKGKYSEAVVYTDNCEETAVGQILELCNLEAFKGAKARIMPDVHAGAGCVIGFTCDLGEKVIPNIVGVDIGCGMLTVKLVDKEIDFERLDNIIRKYVPSGMETHLTEKVKFSELENLRCLKMLKNIPRIKNSLGTLGGGNHFIEVDKDEKGNLYLIIHTGSRNLGKQVADHYQKLAIKTYKEHNNETKKERETIIAELKEAGRQSEIATELAKLDKGTGKIKAKIPESLCYLEGELREDYLHDMAICQRYAALNRKAIAEIIIKKMDLSVSEMFETIHNYIEIETNMIRKGAISAQKGEKLLIPINMRDGCIIGIGKGNPEWNCSAPHGAGRLMSRGKAKDIIHMNDYKAAMEGIYTTSVSTATLDEAPQAYKPMEEIIQQIGDTVDIVDIIKPIYNYKAN